jgi:hypothetical protein
MANRSTNLPYLIYYARHATSRLWRFSDADSRHGRGRSRLEIVSVHLAGGIGPDVFIKHFPYQKPRRSARQGKFGVPVSEELEKGAKPGAEQIRNVKRNRDQSADQGADDRQQGSDEITVKGQFSRCCVGDAADQLVAVDSD